ncbi:MAG: ABC transporter ATP-binding protein [Bacillota bacterium]
MRSVTLSVRPGEFIAVWGPSGSGKSTLLNILGTLDFPTSGMYLFGGQNIAEYDDARISRFRAERIGFVFQSYNLLPNLTAWENATLPARYLPGFDKDQAYKRAVALLEQVGLGDRINHLPGELSGGEGQRVAIARALMNDPDIILADEPTGNLDSKSHRAILDLLTELNATGKTLIVVSHNPEVTEIAHRVLELRDGQIVSDSLKASRAGT